MPTNYYDILGLAKDADSAAIKTAYRKKAMEFHPDKNPGDKISEQKFKNVVEAYEVLKDPTKKQNYDLFGSAGSTPFKNAYKPNANDPFGHVFQDIGDMDEFMRQFHQHFGGQQQSKNSDLRAELSVSLQDAFSGITVPFSITMPDGGENNLQINIPAGIDNGTRIRVRGKGSQQNTNLPAGDLYITIRVADHPTFKRMGADLFSQKSISIIDAALGKEIEVSLIDGSTVKVKIPAGTQPEQKIRLKKKGMPKMNGSGYGDYYIIMNVIVPINLTERQTELLKQFERESKK